VSAPLRSLAPAAPALRGEPLPPLARWLRWEQEANLRGFRASAAPVQIEVAALPVEALEIDLAPGAPLALLRRFLGGDRMLFPKHPLNQDASVACFAAPPVTRWTAHFTSSRSLALLDAPGLPISLKLSTDHPHPEIVQPEKTKLREEARDALRNSALIARVDAVLGADPALRVLRELLVVMVRGGESGFLVRDLRPLADGHHYLPGFALPFSGRAIAELHGEPFDAFWSKHYGAAVGRAKAKLLARYGLQYETPNPQNLLLQLDAQLGPTGQVVFRDIGDGNSIVQRLGAPDRPWGGAVRAALAPETANSFWAFDAEEAGIAAEVLERWRAEHDRAYVAELVSFLELPPQLAALPSAEALAALGVLLVGEEGQRLARDGFERRRRRPSGAWLGAPSHVLREPR
jgi:hypothetical protein